MNLGQRRKLEIARLLAERPNVLLLDSRAGASPAPTLRRIGLRWRGMVGAGLAPALGPVIAVSHDRWFMHRFGGKEWELVEGRLII